VLLVGDDGAVISMAEAVLAKLRFAVTTSKTVDDAIRVLAGLRPDIVVAGAADANRVKREAAGKLSVVVMTDEMRENPEALIPAIRETLRANM
jgi:CheY-like chemotaxis protein